RHKIFPVARSSVITYRCSSSNAVRKIRSSDSTGDEWPGGSGVFQRTFFPGPNSAGRPVVLDTPNAFGPRNCGQSEAASVQVVAHRRSTARVGGIDTVYSAAGAYLLHECQNDR